MDPYPSTVKNTPAATALPMTPATLGPMARLRGLTWPFISPGHQRLYLPGALGTGLLAGEMTGRPSRAREPGAHPVAPALEGLSASVHQDAPGIP